MDCTLVDAFKILLAEEFKKGSGGNTDPEEFFGVK